MAGEYDVVIVGGGAAALSAAIYAGRARLATLVIERQYVGGQVVQTHQIENYPGFPDGISGPDLTLRMQEQAKRFGAQITQEDVTRIELDGDVKVVTTSKATIRTPALILAVGAHPRYLDVPGEKELWGKGVSYCGTCDAAFFREKKVIVVGGGDAALTEALFIARFASDVLIVHRGDAFRGEKIYQDEIDRHDRIRVRFETVVDRINGTGHVEGIEATDTTTGEGLTIPCDGVFVFIGSEPSTDFLCNILPSDCGQQIETDNDMMTSVPGIFAIGDARKDSYRQIATAVGEGATAAIAAEHWLQKRRARRAGSG